MSGSRPCFALPAPGRNHGPRSYKNEGTGDA
jgi:hypothetical protein